MPPKTVVLSLSDALDLVSVNLPKLLSSLNKHKLMQELLVLCECPKIHLGKEEKGSPKHLLFQFYCSILDICSEGFQTKEKTDFHHISQKIIKAITFAEEIAKITTNTEKKAITYAEETAKITTDPHDWLTLQWPCILQGVAYLVFINALHDDFFNIQERLTSSVAWICRLYSSTQQVADHSRTNYIGVKDTLDYILERTEVNKNKGQLNENTSSSMNPLTQIRFFLQKALNPEDFSALLSGLLTKQLQFENCLPEVLFDWIKGDLEESLIANFGAFTEENHLYAFLFSITSLKDRNYFLNYSSLLPELKQNPSAQLFFHIHALDNSFSLLRKNALIIDNPNYFINKKRLEFIRTMGTLFDSQSFYDLFPAQITEQFALRCKETIHAYKFEMNEEYCVYILHILYDSWKKDELMSESDVISYAQALSDIIENNSWSKLSPNDQLIFFIYTARLFTNPISKKLDIKNSAQTDLLIEKLICNKALEETALLLAARCKYNEKFFDTKWYKESCNLLFIITFLKGMPEKIDSSPLKELEKFYNQFFTEISNFYQISLVKPFSDCFIEGNFQFLKEPIKSHIAAIFATKMDFIKFQLYVLEFLQIYDPDRKCSMKPDIFKNLIIQLAIILKDKEFAEIVQQQLAAQLKPRKTLDAVLPSQEPFKKSDLITETQLHFTYMLKALNHNENQAIVSIETSDLDIWLLMACQRFRTQMEQQDEWTIAQNELLAQFNASVIELMSTGYSSLNFEDLAKISGEMKEGRLGVVNPVSSHKTTASRQDKSFTTLQKQYREKFLKNLNEAVSSEAFCIDQKEYSENKDSNKSARAVQILEIKQQNPTNQELSLSQNNRDKAIALLTRIEPNSSLMVFFLDSERPFSYHLIIYSIFHESYWIFPAELIDLMKKMANRKKASLGEQFVLPFLIDSYLDARQEQEPNEAKTHALVNPSNQEMQALPESPFTKARNMIEAYHQAEIELTELENLKLDVTSTTFEALKKCEGVPKVLGNYIKLSLAYKLILPELKKPQLDYAALERITKLLSENHYFPYVEADGTSCYLFSFFEHCRTLAINLKVNYSFELANKKSAHQHFMSLDEAIVLFKSSTTLLFNKIELALLSEKQKETLVNNTITFIKGRLEPLTDAIPFFQTIAKIFLCARTSACILEKLKKNKADLVIALIRKGLFPEVGLILILLKEKYATNKTDKEQYDALITVISLLADGQKSDTKSMQFNLAFKKLRFDFLNSNFSQDKELYLTKELLKSLFSMSTEKKTKTEEIDKPKLTKKHKQKKKSHPLEQLPLELKPLSEAQTQDSKLCLQSEILPESQGMPSETTTTATLSTTETSSSNTSIFQTRATSPSVSTFFKPKKQSLPTASTTIPTPTSSNAPIAASTQRESSEIKIAPLEDRAMNAQEDLLILKKIPLNQMRTSHTDLVILITQLISPDRHVEMELVGTAVTSLYLDRYPKKYDLKIVTGQNYLEYLRKIEEFLRDSQDSQNPQYSQLIVDCQAKAENSNFEFVFHQSRMKVCLSICSKQYQNNEEQRLPYLTLNSLKIQIWPFSHRNEFEIKGSAKTKEALENQLITINKPRRPDFADIAQLIEGEIDFSDFKKDSELTQFLSENSLEDCKVRFYLNGDPSLSTSLGYLFTLLFNNNALGSDLENMNKLGIITRLCNLKSEDILNTAHFLDNYNHCPIGMQQLAVYLFFYSHFIADNLPAIVQDPTKVASCGLINALSGWFKPESNLSYYLKGIHQLLFNLPFNFQDDELFMMFQAIIDYHILKSQHLGQLGYFMSIQQPSISPFQATAQFAFWQPEGSIGDTSQQFASFDGP